MGLLLLTGIYLASIGALALFRRGPVAALLHWDIFQVQMWTRALLWWNIILSMILMGSLLTWGIAVVWMELF